VFRGSIGCRRPTIVRAVGAGTALSTARRLAHRVRRVFARSEAVQTVVAQSLIVGRVVGAALPVKGSHALNLDIEEPAQ
jgi:hypothetical protein